MLDKLLLGALGKDTVERMVRQELERLEKGGFLQRAELEKLSAECLGALAARAEQARGSIAPVLGSLATQVREALDIPSRAEVLALTEALSRAQRVAGGAGPAPAGDRVAASPEAGVAAR